MKATAEKLVGLAVLSALAIAARTFAAGCDPGTMSSPERFVPVSQSSAQTGWIPQNSGTTNDLSAVSFVDPNTGTAVGDKGTILHTTDGGRTWTAQNSGTTNILLGVSFVDPDTGTAVGDKGTILHTTDGGTTWTAQNSGTTNMLSGVSFVDPNTGTAVGEDGTILHTTDGGTTWTAQNSGPMSNPYGCGFARPGLRGVSFVDASTGTAVGGGDCFPPTILRTTNGGTTWTPQDPAIWSPIPARLTGVSFVDANTGMAVGFEIDFESGVSYAVILRTTNGGADWIEVDHGYAPSSSQLFGVSLQDANTATTVGASYNDPSSGDYYAFPLALIMRTTDGGASWTIQDGGNQCCSGVSFVNANTGTAVGGAGAILRTNTGGAGGGVTVSRTWDRSFRSHAPTELPRYSRYTRYTEVGASRLDNDDRR